MATIITEDNNLFGSDFYNSTFIKLHTVNEKGKSTYPLFITLKENHDTVIVSPGTLSNSTFCNSLEKITEIILGCFAKESNFFSYLEKVFKITLCKDKIILGNKWGKELETITPETNPKWVLKEKKYYLVDITNSTTNISEKHFVFAYDKAHATEKVTAKYPNHIIKFIGVYSEKTNSFTLENADEYFDFDTDNIID